MYIYIYMDSTGIVAQTNTFSLSPFLPFSLPPFIPLFLPSLPPSSPFSLPLFPSLSLSSTQTASSPTTRLVPSPPAKKIKRVNGYNLFFSDTVRSGPEISTGTLYIYLYIYKCTCACTHVHCLTLMFCVTDCHTRTCAYNIANTLTYCIYTFESTCILVRAIMIVPIMCCDCVDFRERNAIVARKWAELTEDERKGWAAKAEAVCSSSMQVHCIYTHVHALHRDVCVCVCVCVWV